MSRQSHNGSVETSIQADSPASGAAATVLPKALGAIHTDDLKGSEQHASWCALHHAWRIHLHSLPVQPLKQK
ncbi:hypothetical protein M413DRAFT_441015 [Hebeloma cylindrosporum]|uniref:Uncharacterized protein n=1 Tax=Hebeloma cylindrosporum TaxID=76867 RepID=A0A0C2Y7W4_HEBCY|nr:hypothetical protein M413DRAFT_441015 [Hebeloma cylindrosporum h7]